MPWYEDEKDPPTPEQRAATLAKLEELTLKADEILQVRVKLASEFMEYVKAGGLDLYEYDSGINNAVSKFMDAAGLEEYWNPGIEEFWLPSNIGC